VSAIDRIMNFCLLYSLLAAIALSHRGARAWRRNYIHRFAYRDNRAHEHRAAAARILPGYMSDDNVAYTALDAEAPMLKGALRLGASQPKSIIALFPPVGGNAEGGIGLGKGWYEYNPDAQVVVFNADAFSLDRASSAAWNLLPTLFNSSSSLSSPAVDGYDANYKSFDAARSRSNFFGDVLLACCNDVSHALQEVLSEYGLTDENLILAGFSQGASIAAYTGFMRGVAGIILMGGPGALQLRLLPPPARTKTQVCIISGDLDPYAPPNKLADAFRPYGGHVNILPGVGHVIVQDHIDLGGAFISTVLAKANAANATA